MDKELAKIIESALKAPKPKCPKCGVEGVMKGCSMIAWCECPNCGKKLGETVVY